LRANEKEKEKTATHNGEVHNAKTEEAPRADAGKTNRETEERQTVLAAISRITARTQDRLQTLRLPTAAESDQPLLNQRQSRVIFKGLIHSTRLRRRHQRKRSESK
jgi:hypothetical protein